MVDIVESLKLLADECTDAADAQEMQDAMSAIILPRVAIEQERERAEKHVEILPRCAAAKEQVEALNTQVADLNRMVVSIAGDLHRARMTLAEHLAHRPTADSYPTVRELEAFGKETARLEAVLAAAEEASCNHGARLTDIRQAGFRALAEFNRLAAQERALRPAE